MTVRRSFVKRGLKGLRRYVHDTRGATAVEYGLIVSLIVITLLVALIQVADTTVGTWNNVSNKVAAAH